MTLPCILKGSISCVGGLGWGVGKRVVGDSFVGVEDVKDPHAMLDNFFLRSEVGCRI